MIGPGSTGVPPGARGFRRARLIEAALFGALLALGAILPPDRPLPFDLCPWHRLTGWDCLGCGLTRSICHLLQGDLAGSLALHPAGPLVAALFAGLALVRAIEAWRGDQTSRTTRAQ